MSDEQIAAFTVRIDKSIARLQRIHFGLFIATILVVGLFWIDTATYVFTKQTSYLWMLALHISTFAFAALVRRRVARSIHFIKIFRHHSLGAMRAVDFNVARSHHEQAIAAVEMI